MSIFAKLIPPLWGFLYGWTLFSVIETGTIAAVAVAFARFSGVLWPLISEDKYLIAPFRLSSHYALSLSTAQLLAIGVIAFLTFSNTLGLRYGKLIQNVFTIAKTGALGGLIVLGILLGRNASALHANFSSPWQARGIDSLGRRAHCGDDVRPAHRDMPQPDRVAVLGRFMAQHRLRRRCG
jgi:APA family basic amino acid/polyamine antiporter